MKLKKIISGVLKHGILREFEISNSTYYELIVCKHVLLFKKFPNLKFLLTIFGFNFFYPFLNEKINEYYTDTQH